MNNSRCSLCTFIPQQELLVYEHPDFLITHSHECNIAGYLLAFPRAHVTRMCDLDPKLLTNMITLLQTLQRALYKLNGVENCYLLSFAELTPHYHLHLFPRYDNMLRPNQPPNGPEIFMRVRKERPLEGMSSEIQAAVKVLRSAIHD